MNRVTFGGRQDIEDPVVFRNERARARARLDPYGGMDAFLRVFVELQSTPCRLPIYNWKTPWSGGGQPVEKFMLNRGNGKHHCCGHVWTYIEGADGEYRPVRLCRKARPRTSRSTTVYGSATRRDACSVTGRRYPVNTAMRAMNRKLIINGNQMWHARIILNGLLQRSEAE